MKRLRDAVRAANSWGLAVFKPGYPTARREYMVLDEARGRALEAMADAGYSAERSPCGRDHNYGGSLYVFRRNPA